MTNLKIVADYIREHGWTQGCLREFDGRVCLVGAVERSECGVWSDVYREIMGRIFDKYPLHETISVATWNDVEGRTVEEVLAILESD